MFRLSLLLSALFLQLPAGQAVLTDLQYAALLRYGYSARPFISERRKLRSFAKISPSKAEKIAKELCMKSEKILSIRLTRERKLLYYRLGSKNRIAKINALDAAVIECKRREN